MRKLLRVAGVAAALGAVAWWLRERLLPPPLLDEEPPPPFRMAAQGRPGGEPKADDGPSVTAVRGIGPAYAAKLAGVGISSTAELAAADADDLCERLGTSAAQVAGWIAQASELSG
jgi:predicted flap endonuclease-1-like 5' DNA nuclease